MPYISTDLAACQLHIMVGADAVIERNLSSPINRHISTRLSYNCSSPFRIAAGVYLLKYGAIVISLLVFYDSTKVWSLKKNPRHFEKWRGVYVMSFVAGMSAFSGACVTALLYGN